MICIGFKLVDLICDFGLCCVLFEFFGKYQEVLVGVQENEGYFGVGYEKWVGFGDFCWVLFNFLVGSYNVQIVVIVFFVWLYGWIYVRCVFVYVRFDVFDFDCF